MGRLIDADFLISEIEKYNKDNWHGMTWSSRMVASILREAPKVDAVEVVRCKDCKYWHTEACVMDDWNFSDTTVSDYCSRGERKE